MIVFFWENFCLKVIEYIDRRFRDLLIINAVKFFSPRHYYEEVNDRDSQTKRSLQCSYEKISIGESPIVDTAKCLGEMAKLICTIINHTQKK